MRILHTGAVMAATFLVPMETQIILAVNFFDPNDYRGVIAQEVQCPTGRALGTRGQVCLLIWPRPRMKIIDVSFVNVPGGFAPEFMSTDLSQLDATIRPLIWDQVDFASLEVDGLDMVLGG